MPTATTNIEAKRTRGASLDSHEIRSRRNRDQTYTTKTRFSGSGALSEADPAMRPSTSPTLFHYQLMAVVHRLRNPHARPPVHPKGDRRKCPAWFCVGKHIKNHVVPSRSNTTGLCTSKFMLAASQRNTLQWFARASYVLPSWSASVNQVALRHANRGQKYRDKAHARSGKITLQ